MIKHRKIYYTASIILVGLSILATAVFGLNLGIDFNGGTIVEVDFKESRPSHDEVRDKLSGLNLGEIVIQDVDDSGMILRFSSGTVQISEENSTSTEGEASIDDAKHAEILTKLKELGDLEEQRFDSIGPVIGEETKEKSLWAMLLVVVMILVYIAWAFKGVSYPVKSWKYGVIAVVALFHDIAITVGVFAVLGHIFGIEIGAPFIAALLTTLGYSVNDTIVVFDRIRENVLKGGSRFNFEDIINKSVSETYVRSLNTALTTLFVLVAVFLFGGATLQYFVLALMIGVVAGTYSSIFIAGPLLFSWSMLKLKK